MPEGLLGEETVNAAPGFGFACLAKHRFRSVRRAGALR
ncbi:hypothetical protein HOE425_320253 [Hoeflea sp. EC-HK425]|nr:hypothetical protein HOE425_320253 [Hoeflea sp. EC-HK425]